MNKSVISYIIKISVISDSTTYLNSIFNKIQNICLIIILMNSDFIYGLRAK